MFIILPVSFLLKNFEVYVCSLFTHCFNIFTQETTDSQIEGEQFLDSTEIKKDKIDEMPSSVSTNNKQNHIKRLNVYHFSR